MIKTVTAIRYITPLREGGSLPAIVEADDGKMYVMKFVGAGQGPKALIAELVAGEIGRLLGLQVPELVLMELDPMLGRSEPNTEIQDLLQASAGRLNLGLRYLPNALEFNMLLKPPPHPELASAIVWFDAYVTNVDRTPRNVNMLIWQDNLWLIDHGAALYFHHDWNDYLTRSKSPFARIKDHTLINFATALREADETLRPRLKATVVPQIVDLIPGEWLNQETSFANHTEHREAYVAYLLGRLEASSIFVEEAINAHKQLV
ncbi:HipA family kinase [Chloroflexota bacterium]